MIAFTILGVLVYWWFMGCLGYGLAMAYDVARGVAKLTGQVDKVATELSVFISEGSRAISRGADKE